MKKILVLLIALMFMPLMVKAQDLEIVSFEFDSKSADAESLSDPTFDGLAVNVDVQFHTLNDFIKYKITLKNNTDKDYDISATQNLSEYVVVGFETKNNEEKVLKANSTMELYFLIKYTKEVPATSFESGSVYTTEEVKALELSVKEDKIVVEQKNPLTSVSFSTVLIPILVISVIVMIIFIKKKKAMQGIGVVVIVTMLMVPIISKGLEKIELDVNARISIKHPSFFVDYHNDESVEYLFDSGMTWEEFLDSDYNVDGWTATEYSAVMHTSEYQDIQAGDHYYYFENGKIGVSTGVQGWACNWYQTLDSYEEIKDAYTDEEVINGHHYHIVGSAC